MRRIVIRCALASMSVLALLCIAGCSSSASLSRTPTKPLVSSASPARTPTTPMPTSDVGAPQWIALASNSPADIVAAVRESTLFSLTCPPGGDCQQDLTRLGSPTLVTEVRTPAMHNATDFYIIPILDASGNPTAVASAALNATHTAIHVEGISASGSRWPHVVTSDGAMAIVQAQRHIGMQSGDQPQLVWLPFDTNALETGKIVWNAGGKGPQDPVWLVRAADGNEYIIGTDGNAYTLSQIPLSMA